MNIEIVNGNYSFKSSNKDSIESLLGIFLLDGTGDIISGIYDKQLTPCTVYFISLENLENLEFFDAKAVLLSGIPVEFRKNIPEDLTIIDELSATIINDVFFEKKRSISHQKAALTLVMHQLCNITKSQNRKALAIEKSDLVKEIIEFLRQHLDSSITLDSLATSFKCDKMKILAEFRKHNRLSPMKEFSIMRINHAKKLLRKNELTIAQIASRVGYDRLSTFNHFFKRNTNFSPREYRENHLWLV